MRRQTICENFIVLQSVASDLNLRLDFEELEFDDGDLFCFPILLHQIYSTQIYENTLYILCDNFVLHIVNLDNKYHWMKLLEKQPGFGCLAFWIFKLKVSRVATWLTKIYHQYQKYMKKKIALVLVAVMAATALFACGKKDNGSGTAKKTAKVIDIDLTSEEYAFGVDKDQADLLESVNKFTKEIKDNGKFDEICNHYFGDGEPVAVKSATLDDSKDQLVVATNAAFEPFEYTKGDSYYGIDMEIAAALAEYLNKELVIQNMDFDSVCLSVGQHKCDVAMAGLTVKDERKEYVNFSDSYYQASQKLIVPSTDSKFDSCKTKEDVEKLLGELDSSVKIGYQNGTTGSLYVQGDEEMGFAGLKATGTGYKNGSLAVQDLINGNLDYVIIDAAPAKCITDSLNAMQ